MGPESCRVPRAVLCGVDYSGHAVSAMDELAARQAPLGDGRSVSDYFLRLRHDLDGATGDFYKGGTNSVLRVFHSLGSVRAGSWEMDSSSRDLDRRVCGAVASDGLVHRAAEENH